MAARSDVVAAVDDGTPRAADDPAGTDPAATAPDPASTRPAHYRVR
jgi:hypothetical protein